MNDFVIQKLKEKYTGSVYQKPDRFRHFKYLADNQLKKKQITDKSEFDSNQSFHYVDLSSFSRILKIDTEKDILQVEIGTSIGELNRLLVDYNYSPIENFNSETTLSKIIFQYSDVLKFKKIFVVDQNLKIEELIINEDLRKNVDLIKNENKIIFKVELSITKEKNINKVYRDFKIILDDSYELIIGGSSGLGLSLAKRLAKEKKNLYLVSSSLEDLEPIKKNFEIRYKINVKIEEIDFSKLVFEAMDDGLFLTKFNKIRNIYFILGRNSSNDNVNAKKINHGLLNINLINQISFLMKYFKNFKKMNIKNIVFISSISSFFGSKNNLIYGLSKRGLNSVAESLFYGNQNPNLKIQHYISGPLKTNMILSRKSIFSAASVDSFSKIIIKNLNKDYLYYFYPKYWQFVIIFLKLVPNSFLKFLQRKFNQN